MTRKATNKFTLVTIANYELYQFDDTKLTNNVTNERQTNDKQMTTNKEYKNNKNIYSSSIVSEYEKNIGTLNGIVLEELESYAEDMSEELIIEAIHIASRNNKRSWSYVKAILDRWTRNGYKQLADLKNDKKIIRPNFTDNQLSDLEQLYEN